MMVTIVKKLSLLIVIAVSLFTTGVYAGGVSGQPTMMFIDLLPVLKGVSSERVDEYFKKIGPVVAKHGLKRVGSFQVTDKMGGVTSPNYVNLWVVESEETFGKIFKDEDYLKHVEFRNATFDMSKAEMFMLSPTFTNVDFSHLIR